MNIKLFTELLENLPASIHIDSYEESHSRLTFLNDFEIEVNNFYITFTAQGYQEMSYSEGEEEVGISDGWEINEDAEINVDCFINLRVNYDNEPVSLFSGQTARLRHQLTELLTTENL